MAGTVPAFCIFVVEGWPADKCTYAHVLCIILLFMYYYTVCYFTGIFYAVVRQISMLFVDSRVNILLIVV